MQTTPLPLFNEQDLNPTTLHVPQRKIQPTQPEISTTEAPQIASSEELARQKQDSILTLINHLFPEAQKNDEVLIQTQKLLENLIDKYSIDELQNVITEMQYLCESLLDDYERKLFNGKTLNELLNTL